jgi:hypothetical protein
MLSMIMATLGSGIQVIGSLCRIENYLHHRTFEYDHFEVFWFERKARVATKHTCPLLVLPEYFKMINERLQTETLFGYVMCAVKTG